jgi:integrase
MDLAEIQRRLGHKDIKMTINTYGRLINGMDDDVALRLDALLTTPSAPSIVTGSVVAAELG